VIAGRANMLSVDVVTIGIRQVRGELSGGQVGLGRH
jgi:hypothetical protein